MTDDETKRRVAETLADVRGCVSGELHVAVLGPEACNDLLSTLSAAATRADEVEAQRERTIDALDEEVRNREAAEAKLVIAIRLRDTANALIDAIATPPGRDFDSAWADACLAFGRFGRRPTLIDSLRASVDRLRAAGDALHAPIAKNAAESGICGACFGECFDHDDTIDHEPDCALVAWDTARKEQAK